MVPLILKRLLNRHEGNRALTGVDRSMGRNSPDHYERKCLQVRQGIVECIARDLLSRVKRCAAGVSKLFKPLYSPHKRRSY